ncbi:MAG: gamma-glutamyltransferase family protein, partial [Herminiimonas sp.]|nr:gamma-glutamyltransferase family protein [Herminiimonas sp.]
AFMLHFDGKNVSAFDGRETAPASVDEHLFQDADGRALPFFTAAVGGRAVGAPGVLRMLAMAYARRGKLPWKALFAPAIALSETGFPISPRLARLIAGDRYLRHDPEAAAYFFDSSGRPWKAGHLLRNPALAVVLRKIAAQGVDAFYTGPLAAAIVSKVAGDAANPGSLTLSDLNGYQARVREPLCTDYRRWRVCGMPPPSSGGIAIGQLLGILANTEIANMAPTVNDKILPTVDGMHLVTEAERLAYADRARYVADTDFVALPGGNADALLDKNYLLARSHLIGTRSLGVAPSGIPPATKLAYGIDKSPEYHGTTHFSIVDRYGNALAMTSSIENSFGSRLMVGGFLLNNQLTDFSFESSDPQGPIANRIQPGKRPRSAMSPTLVFDRATGEPVLIIGSPGGAAIITYVAKVLIGVLDWHLHLQQAIDLPNFGSRNGPTELERDRFPANIVENLQERGHVVRLTDQTSGLHGIMRIGRGREGAWVGAADPRREGSAAGQ